MKFCFNQTPVDPMGEPSSLRPADFWGRNTYDHLITLLPQLMTDDGVTYMMQISVLGQQETMRNLENVGLHAEVIDFSFFHFGPSFMENIEHIFHVEELSDAYHLSFAEEQVMVIYLLEIKRQDKT